MNTAQVEMIAKAGFPLGRANVAKNQRFTIAQPEGELLKNLGLAAYVESRQMTAEKQEVKPEAKKPAKKKAGQTKQQYKRRDLRAED